MDCGVAMIPLPWMGPSTGLADAHKKPLLPKEMVSVMLSSACKPLERHGNPISPLSPPFPAIFHRFSPFFTVSLDFTAPAVSW